MRFRAPHLERRCWPHWRWCHSAATPPELTAAPSLTWCRGRNGCIRSSKASSCYSTGHVRFLEEPMLNASTVSHTRSLLSGCARKAKSWRRRSSRVLRLLLRRRVLLLPLLLQLLLWAKTACGCDQGTMASAKGLRELLHLDYADRHMSRPFMPQIQTRQVWRLCNFECSSGSEPSN